MNKAFTLLQDYTQIVSCACAVVKMNTMGVFYSSTALILITFVSYFTVSYSSPAVFDGSSKDVISNNTDRSCVKLLSSPDKSITYHCIGECLESCTISDRTVSEHTVAKISCNPGYFPSNDDGNETTSVCIEKKWIPAHVKCHKMCDKLYSNQLNVHLECFQGNKSIPCEDKSLISGARVRSTCKYAHKYDNYKNTYQEINCGEDGKWDAAPIPCISGCEKKPESLYQAPWHVMILHNVLEKLQGCFGTIISPRLILTVESCLFVGMELGFKGDADPQHYSLLVTRFPQYQRLYEIAEFKYFNQTKFVYSMNRSLTPMIVVLKENLDFNSFVSPAYIQWENPSRLDMWNGTAKVSKLGVPSSNKYSTPSSLIETYLTRPTSNSVKFSSHIACKERWTYPYLAFYWGFVLEHNSVAVDESFLYDKNFMCLEYENDSQPCVGSGVIVEENNCNFIRGIQGFELDVTKSVYKINETVHSKEFELAFKCDEPIPANSTQFEERIKFFCNVTSRVAKTTEQTIGHELYREPKIAASIDIADYIGWIKKVRDEIENQ